MAICRYSQGDKTPHFRAIPDNSTTIAHIPIYQCQPLPTIPSATPTIPSPQPLSFQAPPVTPSIHPVPPSHPSLSRQAPAPIIPKNAPYHSERPSPLSFRAASTPVISSRPHPCHFERSEKSKIPAINTPAIARTSHTHSVRRSKQYLTSDDLPPTPRLPCHIPSVPLPRRASTPYHSKPSSLSFRALPTLPLQAPPSHQSARPYHSKQCILSFRAAPTPVISSNFSCHFERSEKSKIPAINTPAIARASHPSPPFEATIEKPQSSIFQFPQKLPNSNLHPNRNTTLNW